MASGTLIRNSVLLWENPSPSSEFTAQYVTINASKYTHLLIEATVGTADPNYTYASLIVKIGDKFCLSTIYNDISRRLGNTSATQIGFDAASRITTYGQATQDNTRCIPTRVYGLTL